MDGGREEGRGEGNSRRKEKGSREKRGRGEDRTWRTSSALQCLEPLAHTGNVGYHLKGQCQAVEWVSSKKLKCPKTLLFFSFLFLD